MPDAPPRAVVLVEGESDRNALAVLAARRGRDLDGEGVAIVPMGGAGNVGRFVDRYGPRGLNVRLAGLYDLTEAADFSRGLARAGLVPLDAGRAALAGAGFRVCDRDLEDELIRAVGPAEVEAVVEAEGDLRALRTLQKQAPWAGRPRQDQLRRWIAAGAGRKARYATLLAEAVDLRRAPQALDAVLADV